MPDYKEGSYPQKEFFFGVMGSLYEEWLRDAIQYAINQRQKNEKQKNQGHIIELTQDIFEQIKNDTYYSKSPGRGVFLLQKSVSERKKPKLQTQFKVYGEEILSTGPGRKKRKFNEISNEQQQK